MLGIWFYSVFGFRPYHRLRQAAPWRTVFFALYLLLVGVLVFNVYFAWQLHRKLPQFIKNFPTVTFEKGRLTGPDKPVSVSVPGTDYVLVFDAAAKQAPARAEFMEKKMVAFITGERFYMPSVNGVNSQPIPAQADGIFDAARLQQYAPSLRGLLQSMAFFGAFFIMGMFFVFSVLLAAAVVFFWSGLKRNRLPLSVIWRWAVFLQGPAMVLWLVNLIWGLPLFPFALFVLFNIYVQQIFNTLPQK